MNTDSPPPSQSSNDAPVPSDTAAPNDFFRQIVVVAMGLLILVIVIYLLEKFAVILQQLLIALFIAFLLLPIFKWFRSRFSVMASYALVVLAFVAVSLFLSWQIQDSLLDLHEKLPVYKKNFSHILKQSSTIFPGVEPEEVVHVFRQDIESVDQSYSLLKSILGTLFNLVGQTIVVLIYLAFLVAERASLPDRIKQSFDPERAERVQRLVDGISEAISNYISVKTFVSFLTGLFTTIVLMIFGVDYAILWGIITFFFNYIPYIGAIVAVLLPSFLALVQFDSLWFAILIWCLLNAVQCIIGYWLEPIMTGSKLNLSPLVVLLALAFWGALWGIVGMILAVPIVVSIKIILEATPETRPLGGLLGYYGKSNKPETESASS